MKEEGEEEKEGGGSEWLPLLEEEEVEDGLLKEAEEVEGEREGKSFALLPRREKRDLLSEAEEGGLKADDAWG